MIALVAGFFAGLINTVAGGGPILTLVALALAGVDPRIANLTSTVALMPGQMVSGVRGWRLGFAGGRRAMLPLCLAGAGGAVGGVLLAVTPSHSFQVVVPWLVLFATIIYVLSWRPRPTKRAPDPGRTHGFRRLPSSSFRSSGFMADIMAAETAS